MTAPAMTAPEAIRLLEGMREHHQEEAAYYRDVRENHATAGRAILARVTEEVVRYEATRAAALTLAIAALRTMGE